MKSKRLPLTVVLLLASALSLLAAAVPSASADTSKAEWSIELNLGGFHGWQAFYQNGTGQAELTADGQYVETPLPAACLKHFASDDPWFIGPDGNFWISQETVRCVGTGGTPVTVFDPYPPYPKDLGMPAEPGHYTTQSLYGFWAPPGQSFNLQVTLHPNS